VRVIAGSAKGRVLRPPRTSATRPITDRAKESLFAILAPWIPGRRFLDLFAGTGSVGIEALSRGAAHADFVEMDRRQVEVVRENLRVTKLAARATVHHGDVRRVIEQLERPYDFVLMDPPYTQPFPADVVVRIGALGLLAEEGIAVVGHASRVEAPERLGVMVRWQDRRYGDSSLAFYSVAEREQVAA
jgi:16S rRNA (guanine966-N2)-methyltransferase